MSGFINPTVTLASGHTMPMGALGSWKAPPGVTGAAVEAAIKAGYRNIDAANDYNNEPEVGAAIKKCIAEGVVTRDELFVQWSSPAAAPSKRRPGRASTSARAACRSAR